MSERMSGMWGRPGIRGERDEEWARQTGRTCFAEAFSMSFSSDAEIQNFSISFSVGSPPLETGDDSQEVTSESGTKSCAVETEIDVGGLMESPKLRLQPRYRFEDVYHISHDN
jgi:hypothetical protein